MKLFKKLRVRMHECEKSQADIADKLELTPPTVSMHFNGRLQWKLWQVYAVCELLDIPYNEIPEYFPKEDL